MDIFVVDSILDTREFEWKSNLNLIGIKRKIIKFFKMNFGLGLYYKGENNNSLKIYYILKIQFFYLLNYKKFPSRQIIWI